MSSLNDFLAWKISNRKDAGLFRKLTTAGNLVDFSSNDYLGLARSAELFERIIERAEQLPYKLNGATGSRLLTGNAKFTEEVENQLAGVFKGECALLFNSGYAANQSVLSALPQKGDCILYDERAHACIKDGARLSLASHYSFRHNDLEDLERKIQRLKAAKLFIAVESVYSMDGDQCPLANLISLAEKYDASIILDEAHTTGVVGDLGSGLAASLGLHNKIDVRIYTFGKGMGTHGACAVGSRDLRDYLINFARPFIYTTALPPHSVIAIACAFDYLKENMGLQSVLRKKIEVFLKHCTFAHRVPSVSSIQTAIFPGNENVKQAATYFQSKGFDVRPILSPTVQKNGERLRVCLHTFNSDSEIEAVANELNHYQQLV